MLFQPSRRRAVSRQMRTTFAEYASKSLDWTPTFTTDGTWAVVTAAGTLSGYALRRSGGSATAARGVYWNATLGMPPDREILTRHRIVSYSVLANTVLSGALVRIDPSVPAAQNMLLERVGSNNNTRRIGTTAGGVLDSNAFSWSTGTWYWIRMRSIGSQFMAKIWTGSEPSGWQLTASDSTVPAGPCGVIMAREGVYEWDFFSVGVDGAPAPGP